MKKLGLVRDPLEAHIVYPFNLSIARNDNAHKWVSGPRLDWKGWIKGVDEIMARVDEIYRRERRGWKL